MNKIDFIITYLDGNDIEWQKEKNKYTPGEVADINPNRYRNWDNLHYLFRGIEKFAPWVNKVHFVTCGHVPEWLNINHPKLNIVRHDQYIPKEWLPTFSSRCIDMNFHRIPELAEHFVYFNDDMFLTQSVTPEVFFHKGLPCDSPTMRAAQYIKVPGMPLHLAPIVDTSVINQHFRMRKVVKAKPFNWLNPKYGKFNIATLLSLGYVNFVGFRSLHLPYSYLKSTYEEVWEKEQELCTKASEHRFREVTDVNHWIFTYWQYALNKFYPRSLKDGFCFQLHTKEDARKAADAIYAKKYKLICLNDVVENNGDFIDIKECVNTALEKILMEKSEFEL